MIKDNDPKKMGNKWKEPSDYLSLLFGKFWSAVQGGGIQAESSSLLA